MGRYKRTSKEEKVRNQKDFKTVKGITLIALVVTIKLNCSCLAMERMLRKVKELKREKTFDII